MTAHTHIVPPFDFQLGEAADMIREATSRFARDRIEPLAAEIDRDDRFPAELWPEMGALGLHGITVEEEWGGLGLGYLEHCVAVEEVSAARAPRSVSVLRRAFQPVRQPDPPLGHGRAEGEISAPA